MKKLVVVLVCLALAGFIGWRVYQQTHARKGDTTGRGPGAVPVSVAPVVQQAVPLELKTFGTVAPRATVAIKSQITGVLQAVHVREGQDVNAGELLFTIDPRPRQVALQQAEAYLARDRVGHQNAVKESQRQEELWKKGLDAEEHFDQARTTAEALAAQVQADQAAVSNAQIELDYCFIRAPLIGRAGELLVHQGNQVKANEETLLTINQIAPIQVSFAVPQQELGRIMQQQAANPLAVRAYLTGEAAAEDGVVTLIDNQVDKATGTIQLKGTFPNPQQRLWPGQFVNVVLTLAVQSNALVIPFQAVQTGQRGTYVYIVQPDGTVTDRVVGVDQLTGTDVVITNGLRAQEQVVTDGQLRLTPGARIEIKSAGEKARAPAP